MDIKMLKICVIGFGQRAEGMLRNFNTFEMGVTLTGVVDMDEEGARKRIESAGFDVSKVTFFEDAGEMLEKMKPDGVVISTRCNMHTDIAIQVMKYNIPILIEKPVAVSDEQLKRLEAAEASFTASSVVSFPLRYSDLCQLTKEIVDSGRI